MDGLSDQRQSALIVECGLDCTPSEEEYVETVGATRARVDAFAQSAENSPNTTVTTTSRPAEIPPKYMEVVNKLTVADAQEAGSFLDGCKVYLSGFGPEVCENLSRILDAAGATRESSLSDSVSHIIVGEHVPEDVNYRKSSGIRPHVVTIDWLLESMKQKHPAPEAHFLVFVKPTAPPPPLRKKRKAEEVQQEEEAVAALPAATAAAHSSPVAGTSRGSLQHKRTAHTVLKQPPKIMLSCMTDRGSYAKMITSLGGLVSSRIDYDPTVTHLICSRPARRGKMPCGKLLCYIAAGKWVLHKYFIDASCRAGTFVKEEDYEWGNPIGEKFWSLLPEKLDIKLAKAVYRWRCKVSDSKCGALSFMNAIVCTEPKSGRAFATIIRAGGGQVVDSRQPCENLEGVTHCLVDPKYINESIDMEALAKNKVPCVYPYYVLAYLISDPSPSVRKWLLPEYKQLRQQLDGV